MPGNSLEDYLATGTLDLNSSVTSSVDWNMLSANVPSYTITSGAAGLSGSGLSGSNGTSITDLSWNTGASWIGSQSQSGKISLQGEKADIEVNGKSLMSMLQRIEERLNILTVNAELESDWEELRALGEQYRVLEQHIKDKMQVWSKLKDSDQNNR